MLNWEDYFEYNGQKYYSGTVFITTDCGREREAVFWYRNSKTGHYYYRWRNRYGSCGVFKKEFFEKMKRITGEFDENVKPPRLVRKKERDINGMIDGWIIYIVIMAVLFIFRERYAMWGLTTVVFLLWRQNKIEKEGWYYER